MSSLLAVVLAAQAAVGAQLPPAPVRLWRIAWTTQVVPPTPLEWRPTERGGPAVDPVTGVVVVGTRDGWLRAYDPDGRLLWTMETGAPFEAPARFDGDTVYVGSNDGRLYAVELATGKLRWKYDAQQEVGTTPIVAGDLVLVMTLQDTLVAVDARTGAWRWHHRREGREGFTVRGAAAVVVSGALALGAYSDGTIAALELATGTVRWERKVAPAGDFMDVDSLWLASGRLYAAAYSGAVYALDPETGSQVWELKTPSACRVAMGPGILLVVSATQVLGVSPFDGAVRWTLPLQGTPGGAPLVVRGLAAVPNTRAMLWIDVQSGRLVRVLDPGTGVSAAAAVAGNRAYIISNAGHLVALDLT
jgi:outer membrane protein assembly factor BamB